MHYGEEIKIFGLEWALIHFVENNGMAFGITLGGKFGKLALSLFRITAVVFLIYYINLLIRLKVNTGILISFALILAGAIGNIIDSTFYGLIFSESQIHGSVAQLFPQKGGYGSFLHGKVVDMLYFPVFRGHFPDWFPFWSNRPYLFFKPVFNIADTSITLGVLNILFFQRRFFGSDNSMKRQEQSQPVSVSNENTYGENNPISEEEKMDYSSKSEAGQQ